MYVSPNGRTRRRTGTLVVTVVFFAAIAFVYVLTTDVRQVIIGGQWTRTTTADGDHCKCVRIEPLDPSEVPVNRSMFFIETTRRTAVEFTARQACSVESAARINPNRLVYVLFLTSWLDCQKDMTAMFSLVTNYHNVRFRHIDLQTYTQNTPMEGFVRSGIMEKGRWLVEQYSDALRILTLWKFSGVYMDLDVVSLRPIPLTNFIGAEFPGDMLGSGVIGMQNKDVAKRAIQMFIDGWDGENWTKNGPVLLSNLMREQCGLNDVQLMYAGNTDCNNFTIYPPEVFGPVPWYEWELFFNELATELVKEKMNNSLAIHFWNKMTKQQSIIPASNQPYVLMYFNVTAIVHVLFDVNPYMYIVNMPSLPSNIMTTLEDDKEEIETTAEDSSAKIVTKTDDEMVGTAENDRKTGPVLFTNSMKELCVVDDVALMYSGKADCKHFPIYPPNVFGPMDRDKWQILFDAVQSQLVKEYINNSMAIHS